MQTAALHDRLSPGQHRRRSAKLARRRTARGEALPEPQAPETDTPETAAPATGSIARLSAKVLAYRAEAREKRKRTRAATLFADLSRPQRQERRRQFSVINSLRAGRAGLQSKPTPRCTYIRLENVRQRTHVPCQGRLKRRGEELLCQACGRAA